MIDAPFPWFGGKRRVAPILALATADEIMSRPPALARIVRPVGVGVRVARFALPLELCHCVMFACVLSLLRPNRLASEVAYFCGLAGTLPATITPDIGRGFPSWEYIQFFWAHGGVLLAVVFLIAGQGFKPRPGSMWRVFIAVNVYAAVVGAADAALGWNYGYLCEKPAHPSLMDYLGPWPWYILSLEAVAIAGFWLLDLPWRLARRRAGAA